MTQEILHIKPPASEVTVEVVSRDIVIEAWSRSVHPNLFRNGLIITRYWGFRAEEDWRVVPDPRSQTDFSIRPGYTLKFPDWTLSKVKSEDGNEIEVQGESVTAEGDDPLVVTIEGARLEANRPPDEESKPPRPIDIDNW